MHSNSVLDGFHNIQVDTKDASTLYLCLFRIPKTGFTLPYFTVSDPNIFKAAHQYHVQTFVYLVAKLFKSPCSSKEQAGDVDHVLT